MVVFTKIDHLDPGQTVEDVIQESGECFRDILKKTNNRKLAVNNKKPNGEEPEQLIETVELMLACNEGRHYRSALYEQIATRLETYGCKNIAEMRDLVDKHPWFVLRILVVMACVGVFGLGWLGMLAALITFVCAIVVLIYESIVGKRYKIKS